jgi:hypothetical protein
VGRATARLPARSDPLAIEWAEQPRTEEIGMSQASSSISATVRFAAVTLGVAAVGAVSAGSASATVLQAGGVNLATGATITAPLQPTALQPLGTVRLETPIGVATCVAGKLGLTLSGPNPNTGSVALAPTTFSFGPAVTGGSCTDTIASLNIVGAQLQTPGTAAATTITPGPSGVGKIVFTSTVIRLNVVAGGLPATCQLIADNSSSTIRGATANADSSMSITDADVKMTATSGFCGTMNPTLGNQTTLTAKFAPLSAAAGPVVLN